MVEQRGDCTFIERKFTVLEGEDDPDVIPSLKHNGEFLDCNEPKLNWEREVM